MRKFITLMSFAAVVWAGLAVVYIRFEVNALSDELADMAASIEADKRSIHVLKAELAYLTSPAQLQEMSLQYLALMPPQADQVLTRIEDIPFRDGRELGLAQVQSKGAMSGSVRWYGHGNRQAATGRAQSSATVHAAFTDASKGQQVTVISAEGMAFSIAPKGMGHD